MIGIKSDKKSFIEIFVIGNTRRLPNSLIWGINSFLNNNYKLYEYCHGFKKSNNALDYIKIGRIFKKYVNLYPLDRSYICLVNYDENEYRKAYEEQKSEIEHEINSYEEYFECFTLEMVNELNYIATTDILQFKEDLKNKF